MKIADFIKRILAWLIDESYVFASSIVLTVYLSINYGNVIPPFFLFLIFAMSAWVFYFFINTILLFASNGHTIGNLILKTRVIHIDRAHISFSDAFIRSITIGLVPFVIFNAIYMLVVHTEKTIFDRLTETIVIDKNY